VLLAALAEKGSHMSMIAAQPGWFAFYDGGYEPVTAWGEAAANPNADA